MNGFKCNVTGSTSTVPVAQSKLPRRCGEDPKNKKPHSAPGNCTYGAKQPFYWFNLERNNVSSYTPRLSSSFVNLINVKLRCSKALFLHPCTTICTTLKMEHRTTSLSILMHLYPLHHRTLVSPSSLTSLAPTPHPLHHQPRRLHQTQIRANIVNKSSLPHHPHHYHQR
jgi:hypothetical protein